MVQQHSLNLCVSDRITLNAGNIASKYKSLRPEDFHTDFMLWWVPPPK